MKKYYLAYGSNLNKHQMKRRCPTAKPIGTAVIPDYHLLYRGSRTGAYLTIEKNEGSMVPVAVWEIYPADERSLDYYEGYPSFYYKQDFTITLDGKEITAMAYIMHEDRPAGIPATYYVETCAEGYGDFGFDKTLLYKAVETSQQTIRKEGKRYEAMSRVWA